MKTLTQRIVALSRAHDALIQHNWTSADIVLTNYAYGLTRSHGERAANCWSGFKNAIPMNIRINCCALSKDELRSGAEKKHMS